MGSKSGDAMYMEMIQRLEKEKELVVRLTELLRDEVTFITSQNVEALEDSMPEKHKVLQDIARNRQGREMIARGPFPPAASRVRDLQNDLIGLWKRASNLNDLSKTMVTSRLSEIERELEPFIAGAKTGYNKEGKKSGTVTRRVNTGV
ncbi:MAG TPA: flagellar protein FlgN [Deltaproteobacteria bacterium]|jgi:hypothetical protein|nr:flagellar protein FlgN [Deltaproteobacteria bacterium]HOI08579.1 flagellar protein FlgN [Deltaproteobacteria bacterium]